MKTLYLIRGIPGSGKSSFAHALFHGGAVDVIVEADEYFVQEDGTYLFNPNFLGRAHSLCQERTLLALQSGNNVAVSNTSTTEKEVQTYQRIAEETGAKFVSIVVENRHGNQNVHNVPEDKIQQMKNRFSIKL